MQICLLISYFIFWVVGLVFQFLVKAGHHWGHSIHIKLVVMFEVDCHYVLLYYVSSHGGF